MAHRPKNEASGMQIAFLVFALFIVSIPVAKYSGPWTHHEEGLVTRLFIFGMFLVVLGLFRGVRSRCMALLAVPIARHHRLEIGAITILHVLSPFAYAGALVLWTYFTEGNLAVADRMAQLAPTSLELAHYVSAIGIATAILGWTLGPIAEELVFRGLLFRAWARQWGWLAGMIATALAFGIYHDLFLSAALGSIIYTCLYMRTGSLWAPIVVHCAFNFVIWMPFLGQFMFRSFGYDAANLANWWFHFACLFIHVMFVPLYVWMASERKSDFEADRELVLATRDS
jgi:membrane protease YdiL (CAAX protease family)